jgi:hypothetical protein
MHELQVFSDVGVAASESEADLLLRVALSASTSQIDVQVRGVSDANVLPVLRRVSISPRDAKAV